ncbi:MAG TPA: calcium-binding protein [Solirubrobacterales bacterium]|nr:calcium-binding protein [Solirubrobacterales bacterium]
MPIRLGIRFLVFALALTALLVVPSAATPAGQISIYGAESGTHMTVTEEDGRLVVRGFMAAEHPQGCRLSADQMEAICRLSDASAIEITLGNSGDFLNIASPLPIPVTAYLGDGSDKMIGNAESDTCYSQGARRNRCIGGGGNDVCITGEKNSDCVGDAGNDYCETADGSDGCWGGEGDDICKMGPGQDGCHGEGGNDFLYGGANPDQLYGGRGYDYCDGGPGRGQSHSCDAGPQH